MSKKSEWLANAVAHKDRTRAIIKRTTTMLDKAETEVACLESKPTGHSVSQIYCETVNPCRRCCHWFHIKRPATFVVTSSTFTIFDIKVFPLSAAASATPVRPYAWSAKATEDEPVCFHTGVMRFQDLRNVLYIKVYCVGWFMQKAARRGQLLNRGKPLPPNYHQIRHQLIRYWHNNQATAEKVRPGLNKHRQNNLCTRSRSFKNIVKNRTRLELNSTSKLEWSLMA